MQLMSIVQYTASEDSESSYQQQYYLMGGHLFPMLNSLEIARNCINNYHAPSHIVKMLHRFIQYILTNYSDSTLKSAKLPYYLNTSIRSLQAKTKNIIGYPPSVILRHHRLDRAAKLLIETNEGVMIIALNTGFNDSARFSRAFKQRFNVSPTMFRKIHQAKCNEFSSPSS